MQKLFHLGKGRSANSCKAAGFLGFNLAVPRECCALCRALSAVKERELSTQSPPGGVPRPPLCEQGYEMLHASTAWKGRVFQLGVHVARRGFTCYLKGALSGGCNSVYEQD